MATKPNNTAFDISSVQQIRSIKIYPVKDDIVQSMNIEMSFLCEKDNKQYWQDVLFKNVSGLSIAETSANLLNNNPYLQIDNISDRQLDGIKYHISSYEENSISFYCTDYEVLSTTQS
jgi:hypothetical protein